MKLGVVVHHNGPPAKCVGQPHARCVRFWNGVKSYHGQTFGAKWAATSLYSFGVCPHGTLFTGCGWDKNQAANGRDVVGKDDGPDRDWYTVFVFLGTDEKPTPEMVAGVQKLIAEGRDSRRCALRVLPHNAFKVKACPGPEFTKLAAQWDGRPLTQEKTPMATDPAATVLNTYAAHLGRNPETLQHIADSVRAIGTQGEAAWVASVANSEESVLYKAALAQLKASYTP